MWYPWFEKKCFQSIEDKQNQKFLSLYWSTLSSSNVSIASDVIWYSWENFQWEFDTP